MGLWHNQVENAGIASFESVARSIAAHHQYILHYFDNRSTNARQNLSMQNSKLLGVSFVALGTQHSSCTE
ncbi:transposase [Sphingobacterium sp. PU5-4]|uniref:Transposase n=1 Tax=Sphingobacterium tenebrionis TaxID=3111775 RepID=A0ABU8I0U8_9SPHI